jgi:hypothetical protein
MSKVGRTLVPMLVPPNGNATIEAGARVPHKPEREFPTARVPRWDTGRQAQGTEACYASASTSDG